MYVATHEQRGAHNSLQRGEGRAISISIGTYMVLYSYLVLGTYEYMY